MANGAFTYILVDKTQGNCLTAIRKHYSFPLVLDLQQQRPISQYNALRIRQRLYDAGFIYGKDFYLKIISG